jgi:hypothetical protein
MVWALHSFSLHSCSLNRGERGQPGLNFHLGKVDRVFIMPIKSQPLGPALAVKCRTQPCENPP